MRLIDKQPTISPVLRDKENGITYAPVKRGRWIEEPGGFMCSVCHDAWSEENEEMIKEFNYCPNCGADMRGE